MHGEIIIHFSNGIKFKGTYKNGRANGKAIEEDKDGKRFEGSYKNGMRDGSYIMKDRNGNVTETGVYKMGVKQKQ